MKKAFIFDIDGTLVDSNDFHAEAWEKAFLAHGKSVALKAIRTQLGKGSDQLLPEFLSKSELEGIGKKINETKGEIFKNQYLIQVRPFPKVRELFKKLRDGGAKIALASSSKKAEVQAYKTLAQIDDLVETSASADDATETKPEPDIFFAAMQLLGNPPKDGVAVIGDTPYDIIAARKAGLTGIGVLCGGFSEETLRQSGCLRVFKDPADLLDQVEQVLRI